MGQYNEKVDAYIAKSPDYAKPILVHIRALVHRAAPELVEIIKWGFPFFDYKGPVCQMAAFKNHAAFGFWKEKLLQDPNGYLKCDGGEQSTAGSFGPIKSISDLPSEDVIIGFIHQAIAINEKGIKIEKKAAEPKAEIAIPAEFESALNNSLAAKDQYEKFSPSSKREYLAWFADAKTDATRTKRIEQALEWIVEGKTRNWKYK